MALTSSVRTPDSDGFVPVRPISQLHIGTRLVRAGGSAGVQQATAGRAGPVPRSSCRSSAVNQTPGLLIPGACRTGARGRSGPRILALPPRPPHGSGGLGQLTHQPLSR